MLACTTGGFAFAQPEITGAPWHVTLNAVDESGKPVEGAHASVGFHVNPPPGVVVEDYRDSSAKIEGITDANGVFSASHTDASWSLGFDLQKSGYYSTHSNYTLFLPGQFDALTVSKNRNPSLTLVIKTIGSPISLYAKKVNLGMPVFDKPVGFDLITGDWTMPYGKGGHSDILFTGKLSKRSDYDSDYKLTVSFPNPGDGIQEFLVPDAEAGSKLRSGHEAPSDNYQSSWEQFDNRKPGKTDTNRDQKRNYYFRVHTVLDASGRVKTALYGKIYGDFMQFTYFLNPTPNDRNIEFNPKQNLLGNLKSSEQVRFP